MKPTEIFDGDVVLARYIPADLAWSNGLNFFSNDEEYVQVGVWGYSAGKKLQAHSHNSVPRQIHFTQEVIFVKKGSISARIYSLSEELLAEITVSAGDIIILLRGGHGYDIIEDGTQVLEVKNGPYVGAEQDRVRF